MPKSCCAVACHNHNMMKDKKVSFHIFPVDQKRREKWIVAVKRVNLDGSGWRPSRYTVLCGEHFITGRPRDDPHHSDYVPSIFRRCPNSFSEKTRKHPYVTMAKNESNGDHSNETQTANDLTMRPRYKWHSHQVKERGNVFGNDGTRDISAATTQSSQLPVFDTSRDNVEPSTKLRRVACAATSDISSCAATRVVLPPRRNLLLLLADVALRDGHSLSYEVSNALA